MTAATEGLDQRLWQAIQAAWVTRDGLMAGVDEESVQAESPAECTALFSSLLYECLHSGQRTNDKPRPKRIRHRPTESLLAAAVPHATTPYPLDLVGYTGDKDGGVVVHIDGVRVRLPALEPGATVLRLPAARPALSPGFFLLDGAHGRPSHASTLRLYTALTDPTDALETWRETIAYLEDARLRYRAKVLSAPLLYPRRDAFVVYLSMEAWHAIPSLVPTLARGRERAATVSPFVRELAPGVGAAFEPADSRPGHVGLSFGQHRATAVAEGLMASRDTDRSEKISAAFRAANIDSLAPWRNLDSPDIAL